MEGAITGNFFKASDVLPSLIMETFTVLPRMVPTPLPLPALPTSSLWFWWRRPGATPTSFHSPEFFAMISRLTTTGTHWMMTAEPIAGIGRLSSWPHIAEG